MANEYLKRTPTSTGNRKVWTLALWLKRNIVAGGTGADAIAAQKATLRDITDDARIDAAANPDALKALDLATLLGE